MRYFIELSYFGKAYHGWQNQPDSISVQEVLEGELRKILPGNIAIVGAGRTDAGVHASQMFAHFDIAEIRKEFPLNNRFKCEEVDVWITHIGGYPGKYAPAIREQIRQDPPKLFICGHSHILKVMNDKNLNLLHMNPGAAGKHGFHKKRTMLRFKIDGANISDLEVIELE